MPGFAFTINPKKILNSTLQFGDGKDAVGCLEQIIESNNLILSFLFNLCSRHLFHVYTGLTLIMLKRDFIPCFPGQS